MSDSQPPPWQHLPHSPRAFFGLPNGATREELKQAYSVLIRKFKPDKFPEEFKRIRAAYDQLDLELRSGEKRAQAPALKVSPTVITSSPQDQPHSELSPRAAAFQRIQENDPESWYRELSERSHKTQHDYYVLANLSEVLDSGPRGFADWIAEGLSKHRNSKHLGDLLQSYFKKAKIDPDEASGILLRLAQVLPARTFYTLTDALWHRYISMVPWETFQGVLESCERSLGIGIVHDRRAFTVVLMRRVMWRAPVEWLQDKRKWIEESGENLPGDMDFDHEINCRLLLLREQFLGQLQQGPYGRRILDAIVSFCEDGMEASAKVCACQVEIANHPREFLAEFQFNQEDQIQWSFAWHWISWAVSTNLTTQEQPIDQNQQLQFVSSIKDRMDKSTPKSIFGVVGVANIIGFMLYSILFLFFMVAVFLPTTLVTIALFGDRDQTASVLYALFFIVMIVAMAIAALWSWGKLRTYWNARVIEPYLKRSFSKEYRNKWRYLVAHSMHVLGSPYQAYVGLVRHLCSYGDGLRNPSMRLASFLQNDLGLALYCAAVSFAR